MSATLAVIKRLQAALPKARVAMFFPSDWTKDDGYLVLVHRTGGSEYSVVGDNAQLTIDVYGPTQEQTDSFAESNVLPAIRSLTSDSAVLQVSIESKGEFPLVGPFRPRYQIGIQIWLYMSL